MDEAGEETLEAEEKREEGLVDGEGVKGVDQDPSRSGSSVLPLRTGWPTFNQRALSVWENRTLGTDDEGSTYFYFWNRLPAYVRKRNPRKVIDVILTRFIIYSEFTGSARRGEEGGG